MFKQIQQTLGTVTRFDVVVNSKALEFGEMENSNGGTSFAVQAEGRPMTLDDKGLSQLTRQWQIPPDHFQRLPRALQVAEIAHFSRKDNKLLTLRTVTPTGEDGLLTGRAVLSGRYTPFDNSDVLTAAEPHLSGYELARPTVTRDEMTLMATRPTEYDVSTRKVGDTVKVGITLRNNELGEGSVGIDFGLWRLKCLNGMQVFSPEVTVRQRHMYFDRSSFAAIVRNAVANAKEIGEGMVRSLTASHNLLLPNLDPDEGNLQKTVVNLFKKNGVWTKEFQGMVRDELGTKEEASLFGLIQIVTGSWAKDTTSLTVRNDRERLGGELMQLARAA